MCVLITSIIGWIITIVVAIYTVKSSSRDTDKKTAAIEESTKKQVDSIKELTRLQIDSLLASMDMEISKNKLMYQKEDEERVAYNRAMSNTQIAFRDLDLQEIEAKRPEREQKYIKAYIQELNRISSRITQIKENLKAS